MIDGKAIPVINRTPQLFQRWAELNAFTALMRTNEGITPDLSLQFNGTPEILAHFARCSRIYKGLAAYRKRLVSRKPRRRAFRSAGISSCTIRTTPTRTASAINSCSGGM